MVTIQMKNGVEMVLSMGTPAREQRLVDEYRTSWSILKFKNKGRPDTAILVEDVKSIECNPHEAVPEGTFEDVAQYLRA